MSVFRDPEPPRVELRRYVAGVPFSHSRELSEVERRAIRGRLTNFVIFGGLCVGTAITLIVVWMTSASRSDFSVAILLSLLMTLLCARLAAPFLHTIRRGKLDVHIGPLRNLADFDYVQSDFVRDPSFRDNVNRQVQVIVVGDGERIWGIEGFENRTSTMMVRPVLVAVVPDADEAGERPLTTEEREELRHKVKEVARVDKTISGLFMCVIIFPLVTGLAICFGPLAPGIGGATTLYAGWRVVSKFLSRWRFARQLARDRAAGVVRNGRLESGVPWVVDGQPARWRIGRIRAGGDVSASGAYALEGL